MHSKSFRNVENTSPSTLQSYGKSCPCSAFQVIWQDWSKQLCMQNCVSGKLSSPFEHESRRAGSHQLWVSVSMNMYMCQVELYYWTMSRHLTTSLLYYTVYQLLPKAHFNELELEFIGLAVVLLFILYRKCCEVRRNVNYRLYLPSGVIWWSMLKLSGLYSWFSWIRLRFESKTETLLLTEYW